MLTGIRSIDASVDQLATDVAVGDRTVVGAPRVHDVVDALEGALTRQVRDEPGGGPFDVGALFDGEGDLVGQLDRIALGDLQNRSEATHQVQAAHRHGHLARGAEVSREAATTEVAGRGRVEGRGLKRGLAVLLGEFVPGLNDVLAVAHCLTGTIQRGRAGVTQIEQAGARVLGFQPVAFSMDSGLQ